MWKYKEFRGWTYKIYFQIAQKVQTAIALRILL
jgi:hypothetical protein